MTRANTPHYLTIAEVGELLRQREISAVDLAKTILERIEALEPRLNAYITVTPDLALAQAAQADEEIAAGTYKGPLHGVPVAVKDLLATKGIATTFASRAYLDHVTDYDAAVVERLAAAGAVLVGKTNLSEGAACSSSLSSAFGGPRNPWNTDYITGGSSGGSAAAVASGEAFAAIGSDTAMSIRQPAALCGLVGLKPTYGRVPKRGAMALSFSLDHLGPMTRSVKDAAIMLQVLAGYDADDPTSLDAPVPDYLAALDRDIKGARLAVMRAPFLDKADAQWAAATEAALTTFEGLGAAVEEVSLPGFADLVSAADHIIPVEAAAFHAAKYRVDPEAFGPGLRGIIAFGQTYRAVDYVQAQRLRRHGIEEFLAAFAGYDALVLPTTTDPACTVEDDDPAFVGRRMRNTVAFNVLGVPALSLPCGFDDRGLPMGLQLVGQPFAEDRLLQLAQAYEQRHDWAARHPEIAMSDRQ